jgi:acyl-coenzyme A thioesterase 13
MHERVRQRIEARLAAADAGFHRTAGFRVISYGEGQARVEIDVAPAVQNVNGTLHGGVIAALVDQAGTIAIMGADRDGRPGVTSDLNVSYFAPAPAGSAVAAEAQVLKIGKNLAFVAVDVRRVADGVLVAQGRMTKFQGG